MRSRQNPGAVNLDSILKGNLKAVGLVDIDGVMVKVDVGVTLGRGDNVGTTVFLFQY